MTPQAYQRMERYHRRRWLLLAVHVFASLVILAWAFGLVADWMVRIRQWEDGRRGWFSEWWAQWPFLSFFRLDPPYDMDSPRGVNLALAAGLIAIIYLSIVAVLRRKIPALHPTRWREAAGMALPYAFLCFPLACMAMIALAILFESQLRRLFSGAEMVMVWLPAMVIVGLWLAWFILLRFRKRRGSQLSWNTKHVHITLIAAGLLQFGIFLIPVINSAVGANRNTFRELLFWISGLNIVFAFDVVLYWSLTTLVLLAFHWPTDRQNALTGSCLSCGYDLRGTLAAGGSRCSECGTEIPEPTRGLSVDLSELK